MSLYCAKECVSTRFLRLLDGERACIGLKLCLVDEPPRRSLRCDGRLLNQAKHGKFFAFIYYICWNMFLKCLPNRSANVQNLFSLKDLS